MHRSDCDSEVINGSSVRFCHGDFDTVIACLLDTFDVICGFTGLDTYVVVVIVRNEFGDSERGFFCRNSLYIIAVVSFCNSFSEVFYGSGFRNIVSPVGSACGYRISIGIVAVSNAVVNDVLSECCHSGIEVCPELSLSSFIPVFEFFVVSSGSDQELEERGHTGTIVFHTFDLLGEEC